jgi:hypothetical protein
MVVVDRQRRAVSRGPHEADGSARTVSLLSGFGVFELLQTY